MIRMNYIRYIKHEVQEMQFREQVQNEEDTIDYVFKYPSHLTFRVQQPSQETLSSKIYHFYKKFTQNNGKNGLVSIDEYLRSCESIKNMEHESMQQQMRSDYDLDSCNQVCIQ